MSRIKLITVTRNKIDIEELVVAALAQDADKMAELIDEALEFSGPGGAIIERIDAPVIAGLVDLLSDAINLAIDRTLDRLQQGH